MNSASKIIAISDLLEWREEFRRSGRTLVVTNGCFDLLHVGHVIYLESARNQGDALLLGLNGDESVRQLKGPSRPVNNEEDRGRILAALGCVDAVSVFPEKRAIRFLERAQPDVYVKGGDYSIDTIDQNERQAVESHGGRIVFIPFVAGKSTTGLLAKIQRL